MFTIFSVPKKFPGHTGIIQRNAITSWTKLKPKPEIILLGNDGGTAEICKELKLIHIPNIKTNSFGTPLLNDVFSKVRRKAKFDILAFILSDIIVFNNPIPVIRKVINKFNQYLLIGQRFEADISEFVDYNYENWRNDLQKHFLVNRKPKGPSWMDYFIFNKNLFDKIPAFAIGRTFWDKWIVWYTISRNIPVIDCTDEITAIHQKHDYSHAIDNKRGVWEGPEARENIRLAGGWTHGKNITNANYKFQDGIIKKIANNYITSQIIDKFKNQISKYESLNPLILKTRSFLNRI